jgi:hypothetical protein
MTDKKKTARMTTDAVHFGMTAIGCFRTIGNVKPHSASS